MPLTTLYQNSNNVSPPGDIPGYKVFTGNYRELGELLNFPALSIVRPEIEIRKELLTEVNRAFFYTNSNEITALKDVEGFLDLFANGDNSYHQGDLTGGFCKIYKSQKGKANSDLMLIPNDYISLAYLDDENKYCGITIVSIQDSSSKNHHLMMSIVKNTTGKPIDRTLTFISSNQWLEEEHIKLGTDIRADQILPAIKDAINSNHIFDKVKPFFNKSTFSLDDLTRLSHAIFFESSASSLKQLIQKTLASEISNAYKISCTQSDIILDEIKRLLKNPNIEAPKIKQLEKILNAIEAIISEPQKDNNAEQLIQVMSPFLDDLNADYSILREAAYKLFSSLSTDSPDNKSLGYLLDDKLEQSELPLQNQNLYQKARELIIQIEKLQSAPKIFYDTDNTDGELLNELHDSLFQVIKDPSNNVHFKKFLNNSNYFSDRSNQEFSELRKATATLVTSLLEKNTEDLNRLITTQINKRGNPEDAQNIFYDQARILNEQILKLYADAETTPKEKELLAKLTSSLLQVVKNPTDSSHLDNLINDAEPFSSDWSEARHFGIIGGVALIGAIVLITCGCLGLAPTLGGSSLLIAAGIALIVFSGFNLTGAYEKGDQGLPKHVESFKNALHEIKESKQNNKLNEEEEPLLSEQSASSYK